MKFIKYALFTLLSLSSSLNAQDKNAALKSIDKYIINNYNIELFTSDYYFFDDDCEAVYMSNNLDTNIIISIYVFDIKKKPIIIFKDYIKKYKLNDFYEWIHYDSLLNEKYSYKTIKEVSDTLYFNTGFYRYLYEQEYLPQDCINKYKKHAAYFDSRKCSEGRIFPFKNPENICLQLSIEPRCP